MKGNYFKRKEDEKNTEQIVPHDIFHLSLQNAGELSVVYIRETIIII
jgi:hypothetical protein